jgi:hypothetical protein
MVNEIDSYINGVIAADRANGEQTTITTVITDVTGAALQPLTLTPNPPPASSPFSEVDNGTSSEVALPKQLKQE